MAGCPIARANRLLPFDPEAARQARDVALDRLAMQLLRGEITWGDVSAAVRQQLEA